MMKAQRSWWLCVLAIAACGDDTASPSDLPTSDSVDSAAPDTEPGDSDASHPADTQIGDEVYGPVTPPAGAVPEALQGAGWIDLYKDDLEPFWISAAALGEPVGNFPTFRDMNGNPTGSTKRRPRMLSRQIFAYVAGFLMTGEPTLLDHAHAGVAWLRAHAIDRIRGGCYPELASDGTGIDGVRTAQDQAYCMLGLAAWFYLTRDPEAEADLLAGRDLLFDPAKFWDETHGRIKDALDANMTNEVDVENDGGSELVAQLDPVNAFLLLSQPVLSRAEDREQFLTDLHTLATVMREQFADAGLVWGVDAKKGQYRSKHADFGHSMKAVWMLLQIDKRLDDHPFHDFVKDLADPLVARAFDTTNGRWVKRPTAADQVEYGSDWWIYAEADQFTATLNLVDARHDDLLAETQAHWRADYVDRTYAREVIPAIRRDGTPVYPWPASDTAKCNEWKNGYHSTEHALVLSILGFQRETKEVRLHFAPAAADAETFRATPYVFSGRELSRTPGDTRDVGGRTLRIVTVAFEDIY